MRKKGISQAVFDKALLTLVLGSYQETARIYNCRMPDVKANCLYVCEYFAPLMFRRMRPGLYKDENGNLYTTPGNSVPKNIIHYAEKWIDHFKRTAVPVRGRVFHKVDISR